MSKWASIALGVLLAGLLGIQARQIAAIKGSTVLLLQEHGRLKAEIADTKTAIAEGFPRIESALGQQIAVMHRALGKVIPVVMSEEFERRFTALERKTTDQGNWPIDAVSAEQFRVDVAGVIRELPVWAEDDYLARVNVLRWTSQAFSCLFSNSDDIRLAAEIEAQAELLSADPPPGVSSSVKQRMASQAESLFRRIEESHRSQNMASAKRFIQNPSGDPVPVLEGVQKWLDRSPDDDELKTLSGQVKQTAMQQAAGQVAKVIGLRIQQARKTADAGLRRHAVVFAYESALQERFAFAAQGVESSELNGVAEEAKRELDGFIDQERQEQARKMRAYQSAALDRITAFWKDNEAIQSEVDNRPRKMRSPLKNWTDADYAKLMESLCLQLLMVDQRLLEPPVLIRFNEAFQYGWGNLDKYKQDLIARKTVETKKLQLEDM